MTADVFVISIIASIVATLVVFITQRILNGFQGRKNFKKFEGEYRGYSYKGQDPESGDYNEHEENGAVTTIIYSSLNRLEITSKSNGQTWEGVIYMKNKNIGDLTWKYTQGPLRIGSKEISFWEDGTSKIVYLNERFDKKYGRELLIKVGSDDA